VCGRNVQLMPTLCFETYEDMASGKLQIRRLQRPHSGLTTPRQETPLNIYKRFILLETRVIRLYFATDSICIRLLLFTQLCLKMEDSESKTASTKTEFQIK